MSLRFLRNRADHIQPHGNGLIQHRGEWWQRGAGRRPCGDIDSLFLSLNKGDSERPILPIGWLLAGCSVAVRWLLFGNSQDGRKGLKKAVNPGSKSNITASKKNIGQEQPENAPFVGCASRPRSVCR
jgi:hypothetical protein